QIEGARTTYPQSGRPRIVEVTSTGGVARVYLSVGENVIVGASGPTATHDDLEATARAVIHAVEQLLQTPGVLAVLQTQGIEMQAVKIAMVLVRWLFAEQHELLIGSSVVSTDPF